MSFEALTKVECDELYRKSWVVPEGSFPIFRALKTIQELRAEVKRLKEDLRCYGGHQMPCGAVDGFSGVCDCGFDDALAEGEKEDNGA